MSDPTSLMEFCRVAVLISAAIALLAAALAVFLFFRYNIRRIFAIHTGRARDVTVKKMAAENLKTGQLKRNIDLDYTSGSLKRGGGKSNDLRQRRRGKTQGFGPKQPPAAVTGNGQTVALTQEKGGAEQKPSETPVVLPLNAKFEMVQELILIHTDEVI